MTWEPPSPAKFTKPVNAKGRARIEHICSLLLRSLHLDIGCSWGYVLGIMALANPEVQIVGIDDDLRRAGRARVRMAEWGIGNVIIASENVYDVRGIYHSITAFEVIEHLADPQAAMHSITAAMAPGAPLYVTVPRFGVSSSPDHLQDFGDDDIGSLMLESGLTVTDSYDIAGHWRMTIGVKP